MIYKSKSASKEYLVQRYNTLAEITRNCNEQIYRYEFWNYIEYLKLKLGGRTTITLRPVEHPSKDFYIFSDGVYYFVCDEQNSYHKLYKLRK